MPKMPGPFFGPCPALASGFLSKQFSLCTRTYTVVHFTLSSVQELQLLLTSYIFGHFVSEVFLQAVHQFVFLDCIVFLFSLWIHFMYWIS